MQQDKIIPIAIVDDHTLFRNGVASLLSELNEIEVMFDAANGEEMINKLAPDALPEVILMDITMPVMNGYESTQWLKKNYPQIKVLALSMFEEDAPIIGMIKSGASGYLLKESKTADLVIAIQTVVNHGFYLNNLVSGKLIRSVQDDQLETKREINQLSDRELKFLELCCSELTYKEIAGVMNLSPHTIDNYRETLFQKLELKSRTGLVLFAIKNKLIKV
ncbi:response regulator transcription factor [Mucilaginibacter pocheonensis]|uniref:DNA-binding NarL/FixJ family response regulator n=1 Tax=Mucilaginibacter pocheonensis TaxID=398050 RepID=A0ABU1T752_9SPHI|nr:response regulator transcription factor [Mucilaginibacter pocheonensis]MDR6941119.1 DNA-binding NarL/FixJ family response regulator [Mucilaginibacter pocheonensis]